MTSTRQDPDLATSALLASVRRKRTEQTTLEVSILLDALEWCRLHPALNDLDAATWRENDFPLAGEGAPMVAEFAVAELGAVLGLSTDAARTYLAHALELRFRLPNLYNRVLTGDLPFWRARRIADHTIPLTPEAAAAVDLEIAPLAHKVGAVVTEHLVEEALLRFMPDEAERRAELAAESRHVTIHHDHRFGTGLSSIEGNLDTNIALEFDHAVRDVAQALKEGGCEESLDVRRALALGELARGNRWMVSDATSSDVEPVETPATRRRDVTLYIHLDPTTGLAKVENTGQVIAKSTVSQWINSGDAKVTIRPVIDLNKPLKTDQYQAPEKIREHVILTNPVCIFPHCNRPARHLDLDHTKEYDPNGPPGQTNTGNLAPLCRRHHRHKTFGRWNYLMLASGVFLWTSPHGYLFLRDHDGTTDVTPPPVEPPDEPTD